MNKEINENVNKDVSSSLMKEKLKEEKELKNKKVKVKKEKVKKEKKNIKDKIKDIDYKELKEKGMEKALEAKDYYMSNTKKCLIGLVVVVFGLMIVFKVVGWAKDKITETNIKGIAVTTLEITPDTIKNDIVYAAKVDAHYSLPVVLKAGGEVQQVYVKLGDYVNEGDVLFTIDPKDIQRSYNAASAAYSAASANYNSMTGGQMDASVLQAKMNRDNLEKNYLAAQEIRAQGLGGVSENDFATLKAQFEAADKTYQALINSGVQASTQGALASLEQSRTAYEQARDMLNNTKVKAPVSGIVASLNVKDKQMVQQGMTPITIVNSNDLEINLSVSENVVGLLHEGDEVDVLLNSFPDETFKGKIESLTTVSPQTGTYPLLIKMENKDDKIKAGMFGKVIFSTNQVDEAIVLDKDCLIENGDEKFVFVVDGKKAKKVLVETGVDNGKEIQIISGLNLGDQVITKGQDYLEDGDTIRVVED